MSRSIRFCSALFCASLLLAGESEAQPFFTDVTEEIGAPLFSSRSIAFGDYDNDGRTDLFLAENFGKGRIALLHNEGAGSFSDYTSMIQADVPANPKGGGSIFGDSDNDGDLDLVITIGARLSDERIRNVLLRNDRGVFVEVTLEAGLTDLLPTDNAIWLDTGMATSTSIWGMPYAVRMIRARATNSTATTAMAPLRIGPRKPV